jgi:putative exosortase-associated protein (TIGR04073 family)
VHKNIVNTTNETNLALGITGGVAKGALHMVGRMMAGLVDVVSFPLPTETLTVPKYVWEDYNVETHYTVPLLKMKKLQ